IAALEAQVRRLRRSEEQARAHSGFQPRQWMDEALGEAGLRFSLAIVYFTLLPVLWPGQTVGKRLMGLRVAELSGKPMTLMRSFSRYGGYLASMGTGGMGFVQMVWDANRQALQDKAAHTVVLDLRRRDRLPVDVEPAPSKPSTPAPDGLASDSRIESTP
ncbi:MAG TPA: RDD family protein, partial [Burkholderiaceae bacterium]|nr:RDD family protein [Burkholderiaceae bacterium]